jgi:hypothetical protein
MVTFTVVVLVIFLIGITHLHNWIVRVFAKDTEDPRGSIIIISILWLSLVIIITYHLILWGSLLLNLK